ncbi:unnamed protein product, partial [Mesorhabditis belari]|uniref:Uncharacterized protein n=1 Tax=Mesorhabditis belari TaxID=2138241 RepID=A0AAF3EMK2_9BILA
MNKLIFSLILLFVCACGGFLCNIKVHVTTRSDEPVEVVAMFSNKTKHRFVLIEKDDMENFTINHDNCAKKPTLLRVFDMDSQKMGETQAFIDGFGQLVYTIQEQQSIPRMVSRIGVSCAFGDCGMRGK